MMKKFVAIICIIAFVSLPNVSYAYNALTKLGRGALNAVTFPFELIEQPKKAIDEKGIGYGLTLGIVKGIGKTFARFGVGIYEVFTFPIPSYKPIITDPDSILDWKW